MRVWSSEKKPIRNREGPQEGEYWKPVVLTDIDIPFSRMVAISFYGAPGDDGERPPRLRCFDHRHGGHYCRYPSLGRLEGVV